MEDPPVFGVDDKPAAMVDEYGRWLAGALGNGFVWRKADRAVSAERGPQTHALRLMGSHHNRAGDGTHVNVVVSVRDARLDRWRAANPGLAHRRDDLLFSSHLINLVGAGSDVELFGRLRELGEGFLAPAELVPVLRDRVLPPLASLSEPHVAAQDFPTSWIIDPVSLVEWAVALDARAAARTLVVRYLEQRPQVVPDVEGGRQAVERGEPAGEVEHPSHVLGRALAELAVFEADEPLPVAAPGSSSPSLLRRLFRR